MIFYFVRNLLETYIYGLRSTRFKELANLVFDITQQSTLGYHLTPLICNQPLNILIFLVAVPVPLHYRNEQQNARPFVPPPNVQQNIRPHAPPPQTPQNNVAQPTDTATAQVCYYHQTYGEKARLCSEPCSYYVTLGQREVANIALSHSKLLYVADKGHKCKYLIDTGAAVSVLPKSCANGISDADSLPLVAANNRTIHTYGSCKGVVDVGLKREYPWTFIVADVQQPIIGADFLIHYNLLVDLRS